MHGVDYTVTSDIQTANLMAYLQSYVFIHHLSSCPSPPRLRGSSGARQGKVLFLHVHDSAPVHPSSCPSLVTSPTNGTLSPLLLMEPWMCVFFFFYCLPSSRQTKHKEALRSLTRIKFFPPRARVFPSLWMHFWLLVTVPTYALYQTVCASIHRPVFCPIIWFANYLNLVT